MFIQSIIIQWTYLYLNIYTYTYIIHHTKVYNILFLLRLFRIRNVIGLVNMHLLVFLLVSLQIALPSIRFVAHDARIRFFTAVRPPVRHQIIFLSKRPTAHLTRIRSLNRVHPLVQNQIYVSMEQVISEIVHCIVIHLPESIIKQSFLRFCSIIQQSQINRIYLE